MGTMMKSEGNVAIGHRSGRSNRKSYTLEEKRRIVEETLQPGASVSRIAREHDINTNLIFTWRRQHARGELTASQGTGQPALLPVQIEAVAVAGNSRAPAMAVAKSEVEPTLGIIEIALPGASVRIHGSVERDALRQVLDALQRR
jgi:transposase